MVPRIERGSPRWFAILEYLEAHGGKVQMRRELLADAVGVEFRALCRHIARMEELGAIKVIRRPPEGIGHGKPPNEYVLVIGPQEWREQGPARVDELRKKRRRDTDRARRKRQAKEARVGREFENSQLAAMVPQRPVAPPDPFDLLADPDDVDVEWDDETVDDVEADAWLLD